MRIFKDIDPHAIISIWLESYRKYCSYCKKHWIEMSDKKVLNVPRTEAFSGLIQMKIYKICGEEKENCILKNLSILGKHGT